LEGGSILFKRERFLLRLLFFAEKHLVEETRFFLIYPLLKWRPVEKGGLDG